MKYIVVFLIGVVAVLSLGFGKTPHSSLVVTQSKSVIRMLTSDGGPMGSGSLVRTDGGAVILTNWHICREYENGVGTFAVLGSFIGRGKILKNDINRDLRAVEPGLTQYLKTKLIVGPPVEQFQPITVLGYPYSGPMTPSHGYALDVARMPVMMSANHDGTCPKETVRRDEPFFGVFCVMDYTLVRTNLYTFPGNSGSPVVNDDGQLVGVLNSGDGATHYGNIITVEEIQAFLEGL